MDIIPLSYFLNILAFLTTFLCVVLAYYKYSFQYWKNKNLPYLEPKIPGGNTEGLAFWLRPMNESMRRHYQSLRKRGMKHGGIYLGTTPVYMPTDLDMVKQILLKDFNHFMGRGLYHNEKSDPVGAHLFAIDGSKWTNLRTKLTPTLMKMMFQTMMDCAGPMMEFVENKKLKGEPIDVKDVITRFTTDVIGSCAFGLDCDSFKYPQPTFVNLGKKTFHPGKIQLIRLFFQFSFPKVARFFNMGVTPKDVSEFYLDITKKTVDYREDNNISRKDFLQLLIDLKNNDYDGLGKLNMEEIAAQVFIFFIAGLETSASNLTYTILEISRNMDVQEKIRKEIDEVLEKHDGKVTYEAITDMKYLTQVVEESLRMYPPVVILRRECCQEYNIPGTDVILDKGIMTVVSVYGIHHDPEYYPDPEVFNPDRFSDENKRKRHAFAFLPFGEGPRVCIGFRFGVLEVKLGIVMFLRKYRITMNEKTVYPLDFDPTAVALNTKTPIMINLEDL